MAARRAAANARQRRYRQRRDSSLAVFKTQANPELLAGVLKHIGALPPGDHDHATVEKALDAHLHDWLEAWRPVFDTTAPPARALAHH